MANENLGVPYYYHFRKDLNRPYGLAWDRDFYEREQMKKVLKTVNCEFFNRPLHGMSEFASTAEQNFDFMSSSDAHEFIPMYLEKVSAIVKHCVVLNRQNKSGGDEQASLAALEEFFNKKDELFESLLKELGKFSSSLMLINHWIRVLQYVSAEPADVLHKLHKDAEMPNFRRDPTWKSYIEDTSKHYLGSQARVVTDTPNKPVKKSLRQLADEERKAKAAQKNVI
uniref:Uncharacterized protein n=2 Tax=Clytia hemisphaerica TaxID=252671 RepID=A0A7M5WTM5_9CNID